MNQIQIPGTFMNDGRVRTAIYDPAGAGKESLRFTKEKFGTPVTPETVHALAKFQKEGRLQLLEMGKKVNEDTVAFAPTEDGRTPGHHQRPRSARKPESSAAGVHRPGPLQRATPPTYHS